VKNITSHFPLFSYLFLPENGCNSSNKVDNPQLIIPSMKHPEVVRMAAPSASARRSIAIVIYVLAIAWGVQSVIASEQSATPFVVSVALALTCTIWCVADARARGKELIWPARIGVFFFWPFAVPIYLIWSRGLRGVVTALVAGVAWIAIMWAAFLVTGYCVYGSAWFGSAN
jgi:hypothetical protein